jgi:GntR family phosphonate transport system transcriptional regulator
MASAMDMKRGSGVALWRQIEQILAGEIAEGLLTPGSRLATEQALADRFDVNRHTVRRALAGLQEQGLIRIEQGRGTFVHDHVIDYVLGRRTRFSENLTRQSLTPASLLLRGLEVPVDGPVAEALGLERGATTVLLETVGEADGRRIALSSRHYPLPRFDGMAAAFRETLSITAALKRFGVEDYERKVTRITCRPATGEEARFLHQPQSRPVLVTESISVDDQGRPIEYGISRFAGDRVQLVVQS